MPTKRMLQTLIQRFFTFPSIGGYLFTVAIPPDATEADGRMVQRPGQGKSDGMGLVDWALRGMLDMNGRRRTRSRSEHYEPWVVLAVESFEREMLVFYRRSQFKVIQTAA